MKAYQNLDDKSKRLVNKLIACLPEMDQKDMKAINRTLNRSRRKNNGSGRKPSRNGYLLFYRERYPKLKTKDITVAAKKIGKQWQMLSAAEQAAYSRKANTHSK